MPYDPDKFAQESYDREASRRSELTGALALPLGVVSALMGGLAVIVKDLHPPFDFWSVFQLSAAALSGAVCLLSAALLARSYFNYTYRYVVTPKVLRDFRAGLVAHYLSIGKPENEAASLAEAETHAYIQERYAESAHANTVNNDRKSYYLHLANGCMLAAAVLAAVSAGPYVVASILSYPKEPKVEVTNLKELTPMATSTTPGTDQPVRPQPSSPATTKPEPAPIVIKPEPPPDRYIKEWKDPTKVPRQPK